MIGNKITYREFEPDPRLKDFIKSYWYFSIRTDCLKPFDILPDGYFDLLVVIKNNRIVATRLTGIWNKAISISYGENTEVLGIRFKPMSIGSLLKFDIKDCLNQSQRISLKDFNINGQFLLDSLNGFPEFIVAYLDKQFLSVIEFEKTDVRLKKCFELVNDSIGNLAVDMISKTVGLGPRQLHRKITAMIGVGIKDYSKIVRFKKTLRNIKTDKSDYSYYYDQSHYIREIKRFTGLTPEKLNLDKNDRFIQYYDFKAQ